MVFPWSAFYRDARRERVERPGRASIELGKVNLIGDGRFFASARRRWLSQRRRAEAEPPSGGRVDPVTADRSRRAWPCPARVERAGHGCAARRKRLPREGSRSRNPRARRTRARLQGRRPVVLEQAPKSATRDSAVRSVRGREKAGRVETSPSHFRTKLYEGRRAETGGGCRRGSWPTVKTASVGQAKKPPSSGGNELGRKGSGT